MWSAACNLRVYQTGRQADALATFRVIRVAMRDPLSPVSLLTRVHIGPRERHRRDQWLAASALRPDNGGQQNNSHHGPHRLWPRVEAEPVLRACIQRRIGSGWACTCMVLAGARRWSPT
jgi:hypothetical protein